jgi:hypothetical protein
MNRHTTFMLAGMTLLGLAIAALPPQVGFAQSDPWLGTWQLNLAKSKYSPGPLPKSLTVTIQEEGQNHKVTSVGIDAEGKPTSIVVTFAYDGMPHPVTGTPNYDGIATTRVDPYTTIISRTKGGKLVRTSIDVVSRDGRTLTGTTAGIEANGRQFSIINVYDKQ